MLDIFLNVILPVFLVAVIAAVFQKWRKIPIGPLSQTTLYLLTPSLIFVSLIQHQISPLVSAKVVGATLVATLLISVTSICISMVLHHDRPMRSAFMLSTSFPNAGNLALPVLLLALGDQGLAIGVIVFVTLAILGQSLGVFIAAHSHMGALQSLRQIFKLPAIYAISAAVLVIALDVHLPLVIFEPIKLLSQAAIPIMLIVLGLQLSGAFKPEDFPSLTAAVVLRLLISAPVAYLATLLLGLEALSQSVVVIVYAMPVAVFTIILSTEFKTNPKFVTNAVVTSTLASILTLTLVIRIAENVIGRVN